MTTQPWWSPATFGQGEDLREFQEYQRLGGGLGYNAWIREGKPSPPTAVTPRTEEIMQRWLGGLPPEARVAAPAGPQARIQAGIATKALEEPTPPPGIKPAVRWETVSEGGWDYQIGYDADGNVISREPLGRTELPPTEPEPPPRITPWQEEQARLAEEEAQRAQAQQEWQQQWAQQEAQREQAYRQEQMDLQQQQQQQMLGWYREQAGMQQAEAERQETARLAAQPMSWLQYAAYTGEQPAIQPWMQPLMPQQYQELQPGAAIPGFEAGAETMAGLPQLTTPSAQLWGRMGPTAQQQFAGYRQARTGARPEETLWRRQQAAPPGGRFGGMRWSR